MRSGWFLNLRDAFLLNSEMARNSWSDYSDMFFFNNQLNFEITIIVSANIFVLFLSGWFQNKHSCRESCLS